MGNENLYRSMEEVRRDCAVRAQSLAGLLQFAEVAAATCGLPQPASAPPHPGSALRLAGGARLLSTDCAGMTGRQGQAELRRAAAALHVRKRAHVTKAKLKEACKRSVASQVTLGRYVGTPGQVPAPSSGGDPGAIAPAPVSDSASARIPA